MVNISGINIIYDFSDNDDYEIQTNDYLFFNEILRDYKNIKIINGKYIKRVNRIEMIDFNKDLEIQNTMYIDYIKENYISANLKYRFKKAN